MWAIRSGTTFECRECDHQTSLTAGTLLEKTRKPLNMWFRAVFEISTRRTGISAMDLMRIMGFGSYKTAWTWLHKLRAALVRPEREPLGPFVEMDEALVGGKGGPHKEVVLVAAEARGRVRLAHAATNDKATLKRFADGLIAPDARVTTDGLASYDADSLGSRPHEAKVQTKAERRENDAVQGCHWTTATSMRRWHFIAGCSTSSCAARAKTQLSLISATSSSPFRRAAGKRPVMAGISGWWSITREAVRVALQEAGVKLLPGRLLDFLDPWGNRIEIVGYDNIQFTKAPDVLRSMGLSHLLKNEEAIREPRDKGMAPG